MMLQKTTTLNKLLYNSGLSTWMESSKFEPLLTRFSHGIFVLTDYIQQVSRYQRVNRH